MTRRVTSIRRVRVVVPPKPWWRQALDAPATVVSGLRWYQRMPARWRRREPVARLVVAGLSAWFALLFVLVGMLIGRNGSTGATGDHHGLWATGFNVAACLGLTGAALFLTRRHRTGLALVGAMVVLAQAVAVAAVITS